MKLSQKTLNFPPFNFPPFVLVVKPSAFGKFCCNRRIDDEGFR